MSTYKLIKGFYFDIWNCVDRGVAGFDEKNKIIC